VLVHEFVMKRLIVDNEELHEIECVINEKIKLSISVLEYGFILGIS
jgi:hypothetical protein